MFTRCVLLGLFSSLIPTPQRIPIFFDHSCLGYPIQSSKSVSPQYYFLSWISQSSRSINPKFLSNHPLSIIHPWPSLDVQLLVLALCMTHEEENMMSIITPSQLERRYSFPLYQGIVPYSSNI